MQLSGDQRQNVFNFLVEEGLCTPDQIIVHGAWRLTVLCLLHSCGLDSLFWCVCHSHIHSLTHSLSFPPLPFLPHTLQVENRNAITINRLQLYYQSIILTTFNKNRVSECVQLCFGAYICICVRVRVRVRVRSN
jgi:hypothetical protein